MTIVEGKVQHKDTTKSNANRLQRKENCGDFSRKWEYNGDEWMKICGVVRIERQHKKCTH